MMSLYFDRYSLIDHKCANGNFLAFDFTLVDLSVLLVEVCDKFGTIVSSVALRSKDKPIGQRQYKLAGVQF